MRGRSQDIPAQGWLRAGLVALALLAPAAAQGAMPGRSIGEGAVEGLLKSDLISWYDVLYHARMDHHDIWVFWRAAGRDGGGALSAEKRKSSTAGLRADIEHETGLIQGRVVRRTVVDAADEVKPSVEREFGQFLCPSPCPVGSSDRHIVLAGGINARCSSLPKSLGFYSERVCDPSIEVLSLIREYYLPWYDEQAVSRLLAHARHCLVYKRIKVVDQKPACYGNILGWRMAYVFDRDVNPKVNAQFVVGGEANWLNVGQHHPGPITRNQGSPGDFGLILSGPNRRVKTACHVPERSPYCRTDRLATACSWRRKYQRCGRSLLRLMRLKDKAALVTGAQQGIGMTEAEIAAAGAASPAGRVGLPAEIATVAVFLASDMASYVNGEVMQVNGGSFMG